MIAECIKRITLELEVTDETKSLVDSLSLVFLRDVEGGIKYHERIERHLSQLRADLNELRKVREARAVRASH